jgi:hypothetical protein
VCYDCFSHNARIVFDQSEKKEICNVVELELTDKKCTMYQPADDVAREIPRTTSSIHVNQKDIRGTEP